LSPSSWHPFYIPPPPIPPPSFATSFQRAVLLPSTAGMPSQDANSCCNLIILLTNSSLALSYSFSVVVVKVRLRCFSFPTAAAPTAAERSAAMTSLPSPTSTLKNLATTCATRRGWLPEQSPRNFPSVHIPHFLYSALFAALDRGSSGRGAAVLEPEEDDASAGVGAGGPAADRESVGGGQTHDTVASEIGSLGSLGEDRGLNAAPNVHNAVPATPGDTDAQVTVAPGVAVNGEGEDPPPLRCCSKCPHSPLAEDRGQASDG
jgi:hypothetical protein